MTTGPDANGWTKIAEADKSAGPVILTDGGYQITGFWQEELGWMGGWQHGDVRVQIMLRPTHFRQLFEGPVTVPEVQVTR